MLSGLNLAVFGISRLDLEIQASGGNEVLLTLLSDSVAAGLGAFVFSTFAITFFGKIVPHAYFSRNALKMAAWLSPMLRLYQVILYPLAKPSAKLLDIWLGEEGIRYLQEEEIRAAIERGGGLSIARRDESLQLFKPIEDYMNLIGF